MGKQFIIRVFEIFVFFNRAKSSTSNNSRKISCNFLYKGPCSCDSKFIGKVQKTFNVEEKTGVKLLVSGVVFRTNEAIEQAVNTK